MSESVRGSEPVPSGRLTTSQFNCEALDRLWRTAASSALALRGFFTSFSPPPAAMGIAQPVQRQSGATRMVRLVSPEDTKNPQKWSAVSAARAGACCTILRRSARWPPAAFTRAPDSRLLAPTARTRPCAPAQRARPPAPTPGVQGRPPTHTPGKTAPEQFGESAGEVEQQLHQARRARRLASSAPGAAPSTRPRGGPGRRGPARSQPPSPHRPLLNPPDVAPAAGPRHDGGAHG